MWATAHEAVLSRLQSQFGPDPDSPFPNYAAPRQAPAQKPIGVTLRGKGRGDAVTIRARDLLPLLHLPVRLAGNHARRRWNHLDPTGESARGSLSDPYSCSRLGESSAQVPFELLYSFQNCFNFMRPCPREVLLPVP